jgi:hypothetical protein
VAQEIEHERHGPRVSARAAGCQGAALVAPPAITSLPWEPRPSS